MNRIKAAAAAAATAALVPGILVLGATTANAEPRPGHDNSSQTVAPPNKAQIERLERLGGSLDDGPAAPAPQPASVPQPVPGVESSTASDVSMVQLGLGAAAGAAVAGGVAGAIYLRGRRHPQPMQTA